MLTVSQVADHLAGDREWLVVSASGELIDDEIPVGAGPAVVLVSGPTEALKAVSALGLVSGPLDRDAMWAVEALALSGVVARRLDRDITSLLDLYTFVERLGYRWQPVSVSDP